jgi:2-polyprenyl-3-methyl-5-hydroxy-6-metoxy-1,4-benzoquinol methylase
LRARYSISPTAKPNAPKDGDRVDKAGKAYWQQVWGTFPAPQAFDPERRGCAYARDREFARLFADALAGLPADGVVLEAGAADSSVLPHFARLGHRIVGIDYSEIGCERLRHRLGTSTCEVICCDLFNPPASVLHIADLVLSVGLVEHFTDTSHCIAALAKFVRPGGKLLTIIPNMQGTVGLLQRLVAPSVFKVHVPLSVCDLRGAHQQAGLNVERAEYLMVTNFGVVNYNEPGGGQLANTLRWIAVAGCGRLSCAINVLDEHLWRLPRRKAFSPYCAVLASVQENT